MPNPTPSAVHVDGLLTNISIAYSNPQYIADILAPIVPVLKQSNIVPKYDQSHWFRDNAVLRAPGTKSRRGGFKVDKSDTYYCPRFSYGFEIPDELRDNQDEPFNMDRDGANFVTDKMMMRREVAMATDFFTTSVWTTDKTGGTDFTQWNDYGGSSPLVDVSEYKDTVEALIGREPNCLTLGKEVWTKLKWHPDVIDTIKHTQRAQMTQDLFAALVEFEKLLIGKAIYTTTAEGTAEASVSYTRIWGKHALMSYVPATPSLMVPSAMYTFVWRRVANALQYIKRMRDEEAEIDIIEGNTYFDQKLTAAAAGLFFSGAVA